jgi:hypothetical protein
LTGEFDQYFLVPHLGKVHEPVLVPNAVLLARHSQDVKLELERFSVVSLWPC